MKSSTKKNNFLPAAFSVFCMMHFIIGTVIILAALAGQNLLKWMASISLYMWIMEAVTIFLFVCVKLGESGNDQEL